MFFQVSNEIPNIQPETIFSIGSFPVTNSLLLINLMTVLLIIFVIWLNRTIKLQPGKVQSVIEMFYEAVEKLINQITGSIKITNRIFPMIAALFLFVGVGNLITYIPGLASVTYDGASIFRSPTSDFNTTFGLALVMLFLIQIQAIVDSGLFGYIGKFIQIKGLIEGFKQGPGAAAMAFVEFLIGFLDIISEIAKVISLSMRLFGNIYAGDILMVIIMGAFAYGLPAVWLAMSLLVGVIQALVFGALIAAYYGTVISPENA